MKIADLKQPYRRMAEYYRMVERSELTGRIEIYIPNQFPEPKFNHWFWAEIKNGNHPPITEEIKKHFPADFDFSGEDGKNVNQHFRYISDTMLLDDILPLVFNKIASLNSSKFNEWFNSDFLRFLFDKKHFIAKNNNELYTQLAKNGRFDELPDTCEFSEAVELEVGDDELSREFRKITGKFKGNYMDFHCIGWKNAQLPTKKIDFTQFQTGDVVEVVSKDDSFFLGYFSIEAAENIEISYAKNERVGLYPILKKHIKSITKIK